MMKKTVDPKKKVVLISTDQIAKKKIEEHLEKERRDREERLRIYRERHPEEFEEEENEGEEGEGEDLSEGEAEDGEDAEDGFREGLPVQMLDPDEYAAPEETEPQLSLEEIQKQAEAMIAEAQQQADLILQNAQQEADNIRSQAKASGYSEGQRNAEAEMQAVMDQKTAELEQERENLQREQQEALAELEPQLLDTILTVFNRVFHIQFDDKKEILSHLVTKTIMNVEGSKEFRIKASEDNFPYLSAHLSEIKEQVGEEYHLEVVADNALGENKCVIETDAGYFDCSLGVHLESLIKDLKSICTT